MRLQTLKITSRFRNLHNFEIDFRDKEGITVLIGNNGSGKSNILEAISSIFAGLYSPDYNPRFSYELAYEIDKHNVHIHFDSSNGTYNTIVDERKSDFSAYLPAQVISSYSGEEDRLWKNYYKYFYDDYIKALRGTNLPYLRMVYINKGYWDIALLTLYYYDFDTFTSIRDFCQETLGIKSVNHIRFSVDINKLSEWQKTNPNIVTNFVSQLNQEGTETVQISLAELKHRLTGINERDFFRYLSAAYMPPNEGLIRDMEININEDIGAHCLSEGEKKLLLVKLILEVISNENSLVLLDEPDSHIHISRKQDLKDLLKQYENRENVITTHSPTLAHSFEPNHITMLTKKENNDVQIEPKEKQEIIYELTKGIWSYQEQNIFLASNNDILLVEGKSDETFLKKALDVLGKEDEKYTNLKFEYLPCGGADGVKLMTKKFRPKTGQSIIAFFDSDQAGWSSINKIFERTDKNKFTSNDFNQYRKQEDIWIAVYPIRPYYQGGANFNIEDYFSKSLLNKYILNSFKGTSTIITKDNFKKSLETNCKDFADKEFKHFKKVFDLIIEIKSKSVNPI